MRIPAQLVVALVLLSAACGSSGSKTNNDGGSGGSGGSGSGGSGGNGGSSSTGGSGGSSSTGGSGGSGGSTGGARADAAADVSSPPDAAGDGAPADTAADRGGDGSADAQRDATTATDARDAAATDTATAASPCPAAPANCRVMPLGDSITQGFSVQGGYRIPLFSRAVAAGQHLTFVGSAPPNGPDTVSGQPFPKAHEGYSGYTIDPAPTFGRMGISPLTPGAITTNTPHVILLMIGTNDIDLQNAAATAPQRLGALLDSIFTTAPNVTVILAQITPTRSNTDAIADNEILNDRIRAYNAAMPALVSARVAAGRKLILVDMFAALSAVSGYKTSLLADRLHPNTAGYARIGDAWYAALGPMLH